MKFKNKYLILTIGIIGFILLTINSIKMRYLYNVKLELEISQILFIIGLICFGLYFITKKRRKILNKIMIVIFGICLALNLYLVTEYYETLQSQKRFEEYSKLETCEQMEKRFEIDLKNGVIKYFQFGFGYDIELDKTLKEKYKIETFGMGCSLQSEMICYNKLVSNYLKEKYNDGIIDYYE